MAFIRPSSNQLTPSPKLHFALNDATQWMIHYNGFNYEEFYEFIIDFFEDDQTPEGKAATNELFNWWNRYVLIVDLSPLLLLTTAQACVSTVCRYQSGLVQIRKADVARSPTATTPCALPNYYLVPSHLE
jgi:hypothetical protein